MKKFSKIVALSMALAMTLGMTVCAEVSPGTINTWVDKAAAGTTATDSQGKEVKVDIKEPTGGAEFVDDVTSKVSDESDDPLKDQIREAAVSAILSATNIQIGADAKVEVDPLFILDISPAQSGSVNIEISFKEFKVDNFDPKKQAYVLMHQGVSGWEKINATFEDDKIKFTSPDFSNYALFLVTVAEVAPTPTPIVGDPVTNEQQSSQTGSQSSQSSSQSSQSSSQSSQSSSQSSQTASQTTQTASQTTQTTNETVAPTSTPVSPKTGETVPTAVFATMILLAGAAVCAKRAQLNH